MTEESQGFRSAVLDFEEKYGRTPTKKELLKLKESIKNRVDNKKYPKRRCR